MKKIGIIIPAGGSGTRMVATETVASTPKQFLSLGGRPVLAHAIEAFRCVARDADIVVALPADRFDEWLRLCIEHKVPPHRICEGGASRFESVRNALAELDPGCEYIAVHDAARPLVSERLILHALETAYRHGSAIPVVPLVDSVRRIRENSSYSEDRSTLYAVQTPQVFRADILRTSYERAGAEEFTDDASVVESVGYTVMLCEGERRNIKITRPEDMAIAGALLA